MEKEQLVNGAWSVRRGGKGMDESHTPVRGQHSGYAFTMVLVLHHDSTPRVWLDVQDISLDFLTKRIDHRYGSKDSPCRHYHTQAPVASARHPPYPQSSLPPRLPRPTALRYSSYWPRTSCVTCSTLLSDTS